MMPIEDRGTTKEPRRPIAAFGFGKQHVPCVVCNDGSVWLWTVPASVIDGLSPHNQCLVQIDADYFNGLPHDWVAFHTPIPGTPAYAEYMEER
ncbi:MAG TPA: hypothetical protein VH439_17155 [Gemmatimonadales bacterium]|jgi:hypothetical protein